MFENLKLVIKNSYSPLSKFKTACIIKCKNGQEIIGVNVENKSFKGGMCAEQVAISSAISEGFKKEDFEEIHILGSSNKACMPCFLCREYLFEFFLPDTKVFCYNNRGKFKCYTVSQLCPLPFILEVKKWLMN